MSNLHISYFLFRNIGKSFKMHIHTDSKVAYENVLIKNFAFINKCI
jgi:hypothetical protein